MPDFYSYACIATRDLWAVTQRIFMMSLLTINFPEMKYRVFHVDCGISNIAFFPEHPVHVVQVDQTMQCWNSSTKKREAVAKSSCKIQFTLPRTDANKMEANLNQNPSSWCDYY